MARPRSSRTLPTGPNVTAGTTGTVAPGPEIRIAAFGDSIMWGQGLKRNERFSTLITAMIGKEKGITTRIVHDQSRSGAQIRAIGTSRDRTDRPEFVDTYPQLFPSRKGKNAFLKGTDETPASGLYGEIPATFPTILGQVNMLSDALGKTINVVLLNGGANDISPQDVVDPSVEHGRWIEAFDGALRIVAHDYVFDLIRQVRRKCPNALIMYFGIYPGLSYDSDTDDMRDFLQHEYGDDLAWYFNQYIYEAKDVDRLILEAIVRALWFAGRFQYWTRKAVDSANQDSVVRGPGVVFVPSGFREVNAAFAPTPFLWDDPIDPTQDDARAERIKNIPREPQLGELRTWYAALTYAQGPALGASAARSLLHKLNGPTKLTKALEEYAKNISNTNSRGALRKALEEEIHRIQHGLIASMAHPNRAGAKLYADNGFARYKGFEETEELIKRQMRAGISSSAGVPVSETVEQLLTRCKLRTPGPLAADAGHLNVDSIALRVATAATSEGNLLPDIFLVVNTKNAQGRTAHRKYLLNFLYAPLDGFPLGNLVAVRKFYPQFEPGSIDFFTVDTAGQLRLSEITGCALVVGPDRYSGSNRTGYGKIWHPEEVRLEINGVEVANPTFSGQYLGPGSALDLQWPAPAPGFVAPTLQVIQLAPARPLVIPVHRMRPGAAAAAARLAAPAPQAAVDAEVAAAAAALQGRRRRARR